MSLPLLGEGEGEARHATTLATVSDLVVQSTFLASKEAAFHVTASPSAAAAVGSAAAKLLSLVNRSLRSAAPSTSTPAAFASVDDIENRFGDAVEVVDALLEQADSWLDRVRSANAKARSKKLDAQSPLVPAASASPVISTATTIQRGVLRPQLAFTDIIDNSSNSTFKATTKLKEKHNAIIPLEKTTTAHPYEYEINNIEYPAKVLTFRPEIMYGSLEETPFHFVDTPKQFEEMLSILEGVDEIAIDLEHHDYRTFQGFTCLIQLSTRKEDYIIDALVLRAHIPQLNKVLSNPKIVKLFHGAEMDMVWLQRDFGCYVVGLFDTYHASKVLELEAHGLAFLLKYYCGVETNKKYQLADWRVRPIPKEMMKYARIDTHYLLYIYDRMRNDILEKDLDTKQPLRVVLERSARTSLNLYQKEVYDAEEGEGPNGWASHLRKSALALTPLQLAVYKALHAWRDRTARIEDESVRYVTPSPMLVSIASEMPTDMKSLAACCHPMMPNLLKVYAQDVLLLIEKTRVSELENLKGKEEEALKVIAELSGNKKVESTAASAAHTRFDGTDVDAGTNSTSTPKKSVTALRFVSMPSPVKGTFKLNKVKTNIIVKSKASSLSLGSFMIPRPGVECTAKAEAEKIRASLFLVPPSFAKKRGAPEDGDEDDQPKLKKPMLSAPPPIKKVTMETLVPVGKAAQKSHSAPANVSAALKAAKVFDESVQKEKKEATIPALPGGAYVYPSAEEVLPLIGADEKAEKGKSKEKVFNPYSEPTSDVKNVGVAKGPKASKGKSTTYRK
ncbi:Exosome component 10 [Rhizoclosmatium hyalinum]|nr:Exosome component 10 [Rhizoclosmatium hyalinum]